MKRSQKQTVLSEKRSSAMPEVKKLVSTHGRTIITWCLNQLREYDKKSKELIKIEKEAEELRKSLNK